MKKNQAQRLVISAARKVAETHPENYPFEKQYIHVLTKRVTRLRRALRDLDLSVNDDETEDGKDGA